MTVKKPSLFQNDIHMIAGQRQDRVAGPELRLDARSWPESALMMPSGCRNISRQISAPATHEMTTGRYTITRKKVRPRMPAFEHHRQPQRDRHHRQDGPEAVDERVS